MNITMKGLKISVKAEEASTGRKVEAEVAIEEVSVEVTEISEAVKMIGDLFKSSINEEKEEGKEDSFERNYNKNLERFEKLSKEIKEFSL